MARKVIDKIIRTGYTSADVVCFIQEITVTIEQVSVLDGAGRALSSMSPDSFGTHRFNFTSDAKITKNSVVHSSKAGGGTQTVSYVNTQGNFTAHDHAGSGGDIATVTYTLPLRDLVIDLTTIDGVFVEGDTL